MEGTSSTAALDEDAQQFACAKSSIFCPSSPSLSAGSVVGRASDVWRRPRSVSTISSLEFSSEDQPVSCVSRETANGDCATQRFIIWAAIRRNECPRMKEKERLECPLLHCTRRFPDHESMLRHLVACDFLPSCEYWCYDHMRVERFDDSHCQKGLGHTSSKRRKMLSVAKRFISSLGHSAGKAAGDSDALVSPSSASISDQNTDNLPYASASLVSLFSLNGNSSVSRTFRKGNGNSSRRSSQSSSQGSNQISNSRRSLGQRSSATVADTKRHSNCTHRGPLTRSKAVVCAELQSTEIVELDSKEVPAISKSALLSPSNPRAHAFASPTDPTATISPEIFHSMPSTVPSMVAFSDPTPDEAHIFSPTSSTSHSSPVPPLSLCATSPAATSADFSTEMSTVDPVQLVLTDIDSSTPLASLSSPASPLPVCPTPPLSASTDFTTKASTIDPMQLVLSGIDTTNDFERSLMVWESETATAAFGGIPAGNTTSIPPLYIPFQVGSPSARPPRPTSTTSPRSKNLSPSSSVRSTTSTWSNLTATSTMTAATTISNVSDVSDVSALTGTGCASATPPGLPQPSDGSEGDQFCWLPIDQTSATAAADAMGDVEYSNFLNDVYADDDQATSENACYPDPPPLFYAPLSGGMAIDNVLPSTALFAQDPLAFVETTVQPPVAELAPVRSQGDERNGDTSGASSKAARSIPDVDRLASRTWDLLSSHVMDSLLLLRDVNTTKNALAARLKNATPKQIVDVGFAALQSVFQSGIGVFPFDMLCLLHLVEAFSSVTYKAEVVTRPNELFTQMMAYSAHYVLKDRYDFLMAVSLLWKSGEPKPVTTRGETSIWEGNAFVGIAAAFLDDLEIAVVLGSTPPQALAVVNSSDLVLRHSSVQGASQATAAFVSSANKVLQALSHDYDGLIPVFRDISQKAACGALPNIRRFEIELIQAGKEHLGSVAVLNKFISRTKALCDVFYAEHASSTMKRSAFHVGGVLLLQSLFATMEDASLSPDTVSASPKDTCTLNDVPMDFDLALDGSIDQGVAPLPEAVIAPEVLAPVDTQGTNLVPATEKDKASPPQSSTSEDSLAAKKKAEATVGDKCTLCNYRPRGYPEWFPGSMAKHMMTKHSEAEVYYECSFPGCKSRYRNREDNLRQHEKKVHGLGDGKKRPGEDLVGGSEVESGGAAKRRRMA